MRIHLRGLPYLLIYLILLHQTVSAQSALTVRLYAPNTEAFPLITAYLDVHDAQGAFVSSLTTDQVQIIEEDTLLPIAKIEQIRPGAQFVVAVNPGASFGIRNFQAVSRYDLVKEALRIWAKSRQGSTMDDISLLITGSVAVNHANEPTRIIAGLDADQLDARTANPSIDTLANAVALAADSPPRPGMGRAVLFITSPIEGNLTQPLKDLSDQAKQQDIAIHLWLVASSNIATTQATQGLMALASSTGGKVHLFSGEAALPDIEEYLEPLRRIYLIEYQSKAGLSGQHNFSVQVKVGEDQVVSNPQSFQIDLMPPEPAFVTPPIVIERRLPNPAPDGIQNTLPEGSSYQDLLFPKEISLEVVFDFPDGIKREIAYSALLIDGVMVAEHQQPPFDQFTWKLDEFETEGNHQLQVQVRDELGLTGTSIEVPVKILVERLEADPWFVLNTNMAVFAVILVLLVGGFLFLILILGGRLHPVTQRVASNFQRIAPVTPPSSNIAAAPDEQRSGWGRWLRAPVPSLTSDVLAYLQRVPTDEDTPTVPPIPISSVAVTLGSDPGRADVVIEDCCIEALHARLRRLADGSWLLADEGSIAGTWINYTQISQQGEKLRHGDLINFGRLGFRFLLPQSGQKPKPSVRLHEPAAPVKPIEGAAEPDEERTSTVS